MNSRSKKILSLFTAVMLIFSSGTAVFADTVGVNDGTDAVFEPREEKIDALEKRGGEHEAAGKSGSDTNVSKSEEEGVDSASEDEGRTGKTTVGETNASENMQEEYTAGVISGNSITYNLEDFENNEVVILYKNGNINVQTYQSQDELAKALESMQADDSIDMFQPNLRYENDAAETAVNDTHYSKQWAFDNDGSFTGSSTKVTAKAGIDINVQEAWDSYNAKRSAVIAVIDTGIDYTNPEISDSIWNNSDEIPGNGIDDDKNGYADDVNGWNFYNNNNKIYVGGEDSHGTHCAGTIAAAKNNGSGIAGIADYENIKIMPIKALGGSNGTGTTMSVILAIKYAEDNGADICNLSLGTSNNDMLLYRIISQSDMLFVVAAGNSSSGSGVGINTDIKPSYPASYNLDNIISVANITAEGKLHKSSDYGARSVDIAAPGTDIYGLSTDGRYTYMTGTSMAAPMVTAAAALVYTNSASISLDDTRDIIVNNAVRLDALEGMVASGGMLDAGAAVKAAASYTPGSGQNDREQDDNNTDNPLGIGGNYADIIGDDNKNDFSSIIISFPGWRTGQPYVKRPSYFDFRMPFDFSDFLFGMFSSLCFK